jgi:hypothetical protein
MNDFVHEREVDTDVTQGIVISCYNKRIYSIQNILHSLNVVQWPLRLKLIIIFTHSGLKNNFWKSRYKIVNRPMRLSIFQSSQLSVGFSLLEKK